MAPIWKNVRGKSYILKIPGFQGSFSKFKDFSRIFQNCHWNSRTFQGFQGPVWNLRISRIFSRMWSPCLCWADASQVFFWYDSNKGLKAFSNTTKLNCYYALHVFSLEDQKYITFTVQLWLIVNAISIWFTSVVARAFGYALYILVHNSDRTCIWKNRVGSLQTRVCFL